MKITKTQLRQIITEELRSVLSERVSFKDEAGFTYTPRDDGGYSFVDPDGKEGIARAGSPAAKSIRSVEMGGKSLYGKKGYAGFPAPAAADFSVGQPAGSPTPRIAFPSRPVTMPGIDSTSDYIPKLDMISEPATGVPEIDRASVPGAGDLANIGGAGPGPRPATSAPMVMDKRGMRAQMRKRAATLARSDREEIGIGRSGRKELRRQFGGPFSKGRLRTPEQAGLGSFGAGDNRVIDPESVEALRKSLEG